MNRMKLSLRMSQAIESMHLRPGECKYLLLCRILTYIEENICDNWVVKDWWIFNDRWSDDDCHVLEVILTNGNCNALVTIEK